MYLGVNENTGHGEGQVSFYGLDFSHKAGDGMGGWDADSAVFDFEEETVVEEHTEEPADHHDLSLLLSGGFGDFVF